MAVRKSKTSLTRTAPAGSLAKYDPQKGVKQIAVYEMAEKHYAKAKDVSKLFDAIRAKLEAQAEFVLWWDTLGPGAGTHGGPRKGSGRKRRT